MKTYQFKLGDKVKWVSQSGGYVKSKQGTIVQVVKAGAIPAASTLRTVGAGFGMSRNHESYIVQIGNVGYWPRVKYLRIAE